MNQDIIDKTVAACLAEVQKRLTATAKQADNLAGAADGITFLAQELAKAMAPAPAPAAAGAADATPPATT
jgi:hypothetical protein